MKNNRGMTLLLSILMLSMVLATSLSVSYLVMTGIKLSETVEQSQMAYYAADSGIECALYVDLQAKVFDENKDPKIEGKCAGAQSASKISGSWKDGATFTVDYKYYNNDPCAKVTVEKKSGLTTITALGFNTCKTVPRIVNRSLQTTY